MIEHDNTTKLDFLSEEFKEEIFRTYASKAKNARTRKEYLGYIKILCNRFCKKNFLEITEADAKRAFEQMYSLCAEGKLSKKTICVRLSCYNTISKYIMENYPETGFINPFTKIIRPEIDDKVTLANIPSMKELDDILTAAKTEPMYYLIISIATRMGLSATKILKIKKDSIYLENGRIGLYFPDTQNPNKSLSIIVPKDIEELLLNYLKTMSYLDEEGHLFYNKYKNPLTLKNLDTNIANICKRAGLEKNYGLKDMRTRAIMEMIGAGATEQTVQDYLGLGTLRTRQFFEVKNTLQGCPADLVNFKIKMESE